MESLFDPRSPGHIRVIVESNDPRYLEQRAVEYIREAQTIRANYENLDKTREFGDEAKLMEEKHHDLMTNAIGLLALAKLLRKGYAS